MPYVCESNGRYIGEHDCGQYHYGDQTMVRQCCVDDAKHWKSLAIKNAITREHPAYRMFVDATNALTAAESALVGDIEHVWEHGPAGFREKAPKAPDTIPPATTCIEHAYGTTERLSFQIKVF
jgi:hypothetical protein